MEKGSAVIGLGDLSAGETRTLMAKINVPTERIGSLDVAEVSIHYRDPVTGKTNRQNPGSVNLHIVDDPEVHMGNFDTEVQGKKAVIESSVLMEEAARKVDRGDRDGAMTIIRRVLGSLTSAPANAAVQSELERVRDYSEKLEGMDEMAPAEQEKLQKEMKYRNYQELHQQ